MQAIRCMRSFLCARTEKDVQGDLILALLPISSTRDVGAIEAAVSETTVDGCQKGSFGAATCPSKVRLSGGGQPPPTSDGVCEARAQ